MCNQDVKNSRRIKNHPSNTCPTALQFAEEMMSPRATRRNSESPNRNRDSNMLTSDNPSPKERAQSVKARRSTVSNTRAAPPTSTFKACLTETQVPPKMLVGINIIKVNDNYVSVKINDLYGCSHSSMRSNFFTLLSCNLLHCSHLTIDFLH